MLSFVYEISVGKIVHWKLAGTGYVVYCDLEGAWYAADVQVTHTCRFHCTPGKALARDVPK